MTIPQSVIIHEPMLPPMAFEKDKLYWRAWCDKYAIRTLSKEDDFGVGVGDLLSRYVALAEKAYHAQIDSKGGVQECLIQLPEIDDLLGEELLTLWSRAMVTGEKIYSFNIACKTPVLVDETDIYAQYQIDIAFMPTVYSKIYMTCYSVRRLVNDQVNAAAISLSAYSSNKDGDTNTKLDMITDYSNQIIKGGNVFDEHLDGAGLFGVMHEMFSLVGLEMNRKNPWTNPPSKK